MNVTIVCHFDSESNTLRMKLYKNCVIMADTIERAIHPLFLISFIFGFGILRHPLDRPRILNICYMLTVWSVYAYAYHCVIVFLWPNMLYRSFIKLFIIMTNWFATMISIITTVRECEKLRTCIKKLGFVDHTLEELGILKEYHKIRNSIKWALIMWLTMICMTWITGSYWYTKLYNDIRVIVIPPIMDYSVYVNTWIDITFAFILRYIGTRLDKINKHIEQMAKTEEYGLRCTWQKSLVVTHHYIGSTNNHRILWTLMHLHSELCRIAYDINCLFGTQITLQMSIYFIALIEMFSFQYYSISCILQIYKGNTTRLKFILWIDMWLIIYLIKLISLNHICESVSTKAQKTKEVIHKLTNLTHFAEAHEEICQFVLQISLRPLRFNGMGLFYLGYNFIRKLFVRVLAVIVIMLQMDRSYILE